MLHTTPLFTPSSPPFKNRGFPQFARQSESQRDICGFGFSYGILSCTFQSLSRRPFFPPFCKSWSQSLFCLLARSVHLVYKPLVAAISSSHMFSTQQALFNHGCVMETLIHLGSPETVHHHWTTIHTHFYTSRSEVSLKCKMFNFKFIRRAVPLQ